MPSGAHMEIGTYGDLATMHWVQNEAWSPDVLDCAVTYGAPPWSSAAQGRGMSCRPWLPADQLGPSMMHFRVRVPYVHPTVSPTLTVGWTLVLALAFPPPEASAYCELARARLCTSRMQLNRRLMTALLRHKPGTGPRGGRGRRADSAGGARVQARSTSRTSCWRTASSAATSWPAATPRAAWALSSRGCCPAAAPPRRRAASWASRAKRSPRASARPSTWCAAQRHQRPRGLRASHRHARHGARSATPSGNTARARHAATARHARTGATYHYTTLWPNPIAARRAGLDRPGGMEPEGRGHGAGRVPDRLLRAAHARRHAVRPARAGALGHRRGRPGRHPHRALPRLRGAPPRPHPAVKHCSQDLQPKRRMAGTPLAERTRRPTVNALVRRRLAAHGRPGGGGQMAALRPAQAETRRPRAGVHDVRVGGQARVPAADIPVAGRRAHRRLALHLLRGHRARRGARSRGAAAAGRRPARARAGHA